MRDTNSESIAMQLVAAMVEEIRERVVKASPMLVDSDELDALDTLATIFRRWTEAPDEETMDELQALGAALDIDQDEGASQPE